MKTKLLAVMLLAGGTMFAQTRFSIGVNVGGFGSGYYQSAPPYGYQIPPCPGPDYSFVDGYWAQDRGRRYWVGGFWQPRPYFDNRFRDRDRGRDRDRDRDRGFNRGFERGRDNGRQRNESRNGFRNR